MYIICDTDDQTFNSMFSFFCVVINMEFISRKLQFERDSRFGWTASITRDVRNCTSRDILEYKTFHANNPNFPEVLAEENNSACSTASSITFTVLQCRRASIPTSAVRERSNPSTDCDVKSSTTHALDEVANCQTAIDRETVMMGDKLLGMKSVSSYPECRDI
jgi:hypothetical protein